MGDEPKVQDTQLEPVEPKEPTAGVDAGQEPVVEPAAEPKVAKTFSEDEHQAELDRIAGKVRQEEREKYEREKERVYQQIQPQPQQRPSMYRQQANMVVNKMREQGKIVDQDTVEAVAELMETTIPQAVDNGVRVSYSARSMVEGLVDRLAEQNPQMGELIKQRRAIIVNQASTMPINMINEQLVDGIVKMNTFDLALNSNKKLIPKQVPVVPQSAPSQKVSRPLTEEEQVAMKEYGLTEEEIRTGQPKRTHGLRQK
jgi:hypothetical protein